MNLNIFCQDNIFGHSPILGTHRLRHKNQSQKYTLFSINHRAAPRFLYPAAVEDAQRAVRYIRFHAEKFRINPDKIGAVGGSSGGHLVSLLGVLDGNKNLEDDTPINRMSAKVQCVIARAAPTDFREEAIGDHFLGVRATTKVTSMEYKRRQSASPIYYVSPDDASFLLVHGDQDDIVPYHLSEQMHNKLREVDVAAKLITIEGGVHGPGIVNSPEVQQEFVRWMDQHLIGK